MMSRRLWLLSALLFAAGVAVQIDVRRKDADRAAAGFESHGEGVAPALPEPSNPLTRCPDAARPSDRSAATRDATLRQPPTPELSREPVAEASAAELEQLLEGLARTEHLPADWVSGLEQLSGAPGGVQRLRELVRRHPDVEVAQQVLRTLERLGGIDAARSLYEIGIERRELISEAAVRLSRVRERSAAPALLEIITDPAAPDDLAAAALRSLGQTALRDPVDAIRAIAVDGQRSVSVRVAAVEALGSIADPAGLSGLIPLLESPERAVRREAIRSVGRVRDPRSIAALRNLIATASNEQERLMAEDALARLEGRPGRR